MNQTLRSFRTYGLFFTLLGTSTIAACGKKAPSALDGQRNDVEITPHHFDEPEPTDVIVQLFNWPFAKITEEIPTLAEAGYAQIHVSPPNLTIDSEQWWGRYQPVDYRVIAGPLGSQNEFEAMIQRAHRYKLKIIVDIVFNHTANPRSPLPLEASRLVAEKGALFGADDYHARECIRNYDDAWQVRNLRLCGGDGDEGLPDLDQASGRVLAEQRAFLKRLDAMGVDGFRLDAVKHMEPWYFDKLLTDDIAKGKFIFGEIIADRATFDRDLAPYMASTSMAFYDFPLRATIQGAFGYGGSLATLASADLVRNKQALPWNRSVTFVMNHDIPNNEGFRSWILDEKDEELAYAYLLGRSEGVPYIYSDLGADSRTGLRDDRWKTKHRSGDLKKMITFHNHVHGEMQSVIHADECTLVLRRGNKGFFGVNKCEEDKDITVPDMEGVKFRELVTGVEGTVLRSSFRMPLPARSQRLYLTR